MKITTKLISVFLAAVILLGTAATASAAGTHYLPHVTKEMSEASFWSLDQSVLMTREEIEARNKDILSQDGTNMYDLANQSLTVDGIVLNEGLLRSAKADAAYYLGWTYLESREKATQEDFDELIENTQNPKAAKNQQVLYGIAVRRTALRAFPSPLAIWDDLNDTDFDYQYLVGIRVNEPVVITSVSKDGKFYLAKNACCSGWIPAEDVAICGSKQEWLAVWQIPSEEALVVWGDKVYTENSVMGAQTSDLMLTMGTVLRLKRNIDPNELIDNRAAYNNYAVWMPIRREDGSYGKKLTLISEHEAVCEGYLPMTEENIAKVALAALGNTYGWGGSRYSEDCSSYIRNIYKCFGMELARNTTWQEAMPMAKVSMAYMCKEERMLMLDALPVGTILFFNGHEMLYLGEEEGQYFVISAVGTVMRPGDEPVRQRIRGTVINALDIKRANGNAWLDELTTALVPYWEEGADSLPPFAWYHEGVAYCLKNGMMQGDEEKFFHPKADTTWAELLQILFNREETVDASIESIVGEWYDKPVVWAKKAGLIHEADLDFRPEAPVTREELASVLYRYAQYKGMDVSVGEETNILSYDDGFEISEYAIPAMQYAAGTGLLRGRTKTTIDPQENTTRAEIAVIMQRFLAE